MCVIGTQTEFRSLEDDAALGADVLALVAGGSARLLAWLAVLASGSGVLDLGSIAEVTESAESLAVGRWVEGQVSLADGHTLREALRITRDDGSRGGRAFHGSKYVQLVLHCHFILGLHVAQH